MATQQNPIKKSFKPKSNINIDYTGRDFNSFKQNLISFSQTYFPQTYKDFNPASPGIMFMEMASYIGDVLSYYTDYQFNESTVLFTQERKNIINLARKLGYRVKATTPSYSKINIFQLVPSKIDSTTGLTVPDLSYAEIILADSQITGTQINTSYLTIYPIDFSVNTEESPLVITVYTRDSSGKPLLYNLQKTADVVSGTLKTFTVNVTNPIPYFVFQLPDTNVIEIQSMIDSNGNTWYETEYLAQDLIFLDQQNIDVNNQEFAQYNDTVSYLLNTLRSTKRFITYVDENNLTNIQFGPGLDASDDAVITVNLNTIGRDINSNITVNSSFDPTNFLKTKSYGEAPVNTTLTITYTIGGGIGSNVNTGDINKIKNISFAKDISSLSQSDQTIINGLRKTISAINIIPATGGDDAETVDEIRLNSLAYFSSQKRAVTREDYIVCAMSMPSRYGSIAKVNVIADSLLDTITSETQNNNVMSSDTTLNNNPFALNMYVLAYDGNKNLTPLNSAIQQNLTTYLNRYRLLTDAINIINGFIINIGVNFNIIVYKNYNKQQVLTNCIVAVTNFFDIDNWTFSQSINISDLQLEIAKVEGVQSVQSVQIINLTIDNGNYSPYSYNISQATVNNIIYPSLDPSVFEVKYPTTDIRGSVS